MTPAEITSVGWLHNHDQNRSICLTISLKHRIMQPIYVSITKDEFDSAGGREGLNANKQVAIDLYNKYGAGRPG